MWKRILILLAIAIMAGSVYWWFDGARMKLVLQAHYLGWKNPAVKLVPREMKDPWVSRQAMRKASYFGYEFDIPWEDADERNTQVLEKKVVIRFQSGNDITFSILPPRQLVNKVLSSADEDGIFPQILGEQVLQSDYNLTRRVLETTPSKISVSSPRTEAVTVKELLTLKAEEMPRGDSGFFSYRFQGYECFQFGNPEARPRAFSVRMYSAGNTLSFEFTQAPGTTATPLSQADVDSIVRSVRKAG